MRKNVTNVLPKLQLNNTYYQYRKYNILQLLNSFPADLCQLYKRELPHALGINRQTFSNWLNANITDILEIPSLKLAQIASFLKVPIEELINIPVPAIDIKTESQIIEQSILEQTGLTR